jgi:hypothetical protein
MNEQDIFPMSKARALLERSVAKAKTGRMRIWEFLDT